MTSPCSLFISLISFVFSFIYFKEELFFSSSIYYYCFHSCFYYCFCSCFVVYKNPWKYVLKSCILVIITCVSGLDIFIRKYGIVEGWLLLSQVKLLFSCSLFQERRIELKVLVLYESDRSIVIASYFILFQLFQILLSYFLKKSKIFIYFNNIRWYLELYFLNSRF